LFSGKVAVQDTSPVPPAETLFAGTIADYLDQLASAAPAPGGGSVAALTAAQGAALIGMVLSLTVGRPRFQAHDAELRAIQADADRLCADCAALIDRDATVLRALIATYKLPRATSEEQAARDAALQERPWRGRGRRRRSCHSAAASCRSAIPPPSATSAWRRPARWLPSVAPS
jgi:hypothetical protein